MLEPVNLVFEGPTDHPVLERLIAHLGLEVAGVYSMTGKTNLDGKLPAYNSAGRFGRWLVLRDLDTDEDCAPPLLKRLLPNPSAGLRFRIAVRATEGWLMADREAMSGFLDVSIDRLPLNPDELADPKEFLVNLARNSARREIWEGMVPPQGTTGHVGRDYTRLVTQFATEHWRPVTAAQASASLSRCLRSLQPWAK